MDIGLVYSQKDPRQTRARDFVHEFLKKRGVLARVFERESDVSSPTLIIDGHALKDQRRAPREESPSMYPSIKDIADALERHVWSL
ncbi:MAG: hypothetical protein AB1772_05540 [Candidatus Zixiibacteriota bacterium]